MQNWKVSRHHTPLTTCTVHINGRIDGLPRFPFVRTSHFAIRKEFHYQEPFGILQVGRVSLVEFGHSLILFDHLRNTLLGHSHDDYGLALGNVMAGIRAGAVVAEEVPPYVLVAGAPALPIGRRFNWDEIKRHEMELYGKVLTLLDELNH